VNGVTNTPECSAVAASGSDCDLPVAYSFTAEDGHTTYSCETHRDSVMLIVADTEGTFTVRPVVRL
jgi:hypothetical protein